MTKFYLISDTDYDAVWGWHKVLELQKRGFRRVSYAEYLAHMRKLNTPLFEGSRNEQTTHPAGSE